MSESDNVRIEVMSESDNVRDPKKMKSQKKWNLKKIMKSQKNKMISQKHWNLKKSEISIKWNLKKKKKKNEITRKSKSFYKSIPKDLETHESIKQNKYLKKYCRSK